MTTASDVSVTAETRATEHRIVGAVSAAHFVSHYYILTLPPLFDFVRADYGVSYTKLGLAITVFNVVSAVLQPPAGFLVDRLGARVLLIVALLCGGVAFAVTGLVDSFWLLVVMSGLAGIGNAVYHPADYAILSQRVPGERMGYAYSIHTCAGMLGSAVAPASLLLMHSLWGWRGAFIAAGVLGFAVALLLVVMRESDTLPLSPAKATAAKKDDEPTAWGLLLSGPILLNLLFFVLIALQSGGMQNYFVVALTALHGTSAATANTALSVYLLLATVGVLAGGVVATRTGRHALVAAIGLLVGAVVALLIGVVDLGPAMLMIVMAIGGWFSGVIMPSRDMIVRAITPPGAFGKVFGFVTMGFNIGGIIAPLIFGVVLDGGMPEWVFLFTAVVSVLAVGTVMGGAKPKRRTDG